jgi:titin
MNGIGNTNSAPVSGTPATVPDAPTLDELTVGNTQLTVAFTAPLSTGGAPITNYLYQKNSGEPFISAGTTVSPFTITGLTNGTSYTVVIKAVNRISADGGASSNSRTATPATVPSAPTITSPITPGDKQLTVAFTLGSNGGSAITDYQYQIDASGSFVSIGTSGAPFTITGLTNGTPYPIVIKAINGIGNTNSAPVSGTPATVPSKPVISIQYGNQQLTVQFPIPANGGSEITGYQYLITSSSYTCAGFVKADASPPIILTGLSNGTLYSVVVLAVNNIGNGPRSEPASGTPATVPSKPTITSITDGNQQLTVAFTPGSDGGSPIKGYQYSTNNGNTFSSTVLTTVPPLTITGLTNSTPYDVRIRAINTNDSIGDMSDTVSGTPATVPDAPSLDVLTVGNTQLTVEFTRPAFNGGSAITNYLYQKNSGEPFVSAGTIVSPFTITGLINGTSYTVFIKAVNGMSVNGGASSNPKTATPATVPSAPVISGITENSGQLVVEFTAGSTGGSAITNYLFSKNGGTTFTALNPSKTTSPFTIAGLINDTSYTIIIQAMNIFGAGLSSVAQTAKPQSSGPDVISAVADNDQLNATLTCRRFTSFTPTPSASRFTSSNQYDAYVGSITTNATNTIIVIERFEYPRPVVASYITLSDGVRTSQISNPFNI